MEHSANTKLNDAVTYRQFSRFLVHAEIPPSWKKEVIALEDVLQILNKYMYLAEKNCFLTWLHVMRS